MENKHNCNLPNGVSTFYMDFFQTSKHWSAHLKVTFGCIDAIRKGHFIGPCMAVVGQAWFGVDSEGTASVPLFTKRCTGIAL